MEPTTFLEHYRIGTGEAGREVSRTGAAINYKAIDTRTHDPVRLQLIPLATIEPEKLAQLKERAETAEKLDHVNIAKTFAVGVDHDYFVIVSEHIEGETADSWIVENGPMPADAALRVGLQVVRALGAAAYFNFTHRAIQPSNLIIAPGESPDGGWPFAKLLNFGLASLELHSDSAEAQELARDQKNAGIDATVADVQSDVAFYRGDMKAARAGYEQSLRAANQAKDRTQVLSARLNLNRVSIAEGRPQPAVADLRSVIQEADRLNLKYLSVRASVELAQALIATKDYAHARQELERALGRSEKLGSRLETARIHYLLGDATRLAGETPEASRQYQQALRLFDTIKKEQGAEKLFDRSDLKTIYAEANRWVSTLRG